VCPLWNPRETHLCSCRNNHRPTAPTGAGGLPTREVARKPIHPVDQDVKDSLLAKKKAGAVFINLTAAHDTLWYRGLTCKLLQLLPDRHMVHMIMEMVGNRSFPLITGNGNRSRLRLRLKNGVPQRSVLAPILFSIYISDMPTTISREYAHPWDLAIIQANGDWQAVEGALSKAMETLGEYLQTWKLKLSIRKMVSAVLHVNNK